MATRRQHRVDRGEADDTHSEAMLFFTGLAEEDCDALRAGVALHLAAILEEAHPPYALDASERKGWLAAAAYLRGCAAKNGKIRAIKPHIQRALDALPENDRRAVWNAFARFWGLLIDAAGADDAEGVRKSLGKEAGGKGGWKRAAMFIGSISGSDLVGIKEEDMNPWMVTYPYGGN